MRNDRRSSFSGLLCVALLSAFGLTRASSYLQYIDYYDLNWSPDSRRLSYTFALDAFEERYFPHEAIAYIATDDTAARPVVLTPPLDRVYIFNSRELTAWSDRYGWFVLDLDDPKVARHIGAWCEESSEDGSTDAFRYDVRGVAGLMQSPGGSFVAAIGDDAGYCSRLLFCWRLGEGRATSVAADVGGARWLDDSVVVCSIPEEDGARYAVVNAATGARRAARREEYVAARARRTQVEIPARPAPDFDQDPAPMVSESVLVVTLPGEKPQRIRLPVAGLPANPTASPDGSRIALDIRHGREVWVATLAPDGSGFRVVDSGWAPQWLGNDSLLYHNNLGFGVASAGGNGRRQVQYPRTAHHPRWMSDSVIEFRVGRAGDKPEPLHLAPSAYRDWSDYYHNVYYLARDTHFYRHDELWQVNTRSGRFTRLTDSRPKPVVRIKGFSSTPVVSPDGQRSVFFDDRADVVLRERGREEARTLLVRRW